MHKTTMMWRSTSNTKDAPARARRQGEAETAQSALTSRGKTPAMQTRPKQCREAPTDHKEAVLRYVITPLPSLVIDVKSWARGG